MYSSVGIGELSHNQIKKLLHGKPIRVTMGTRHKIHLSEHQMKRLTKAHEKKKKLTITFDPHQAEQHGKGLMGDLVKKGKEFLNNNPELKKEIVKTAKKQVIKKIEGGGIMGDIIKDVVVDKIAGKGCKTKSAKGGGVISNIIKEAVNETVDNTVGKIEGEGCKRKGKKGCKGGSVKTEEPKPTKSKGKKTFGGGALMPAGY